MSSYMSTVTRAGVELEPVSRNESPEVSRFEYNQDVTATSMAVVAAVSAATGVDPIELEPLGSAVDADALNALGRGQDTTTDGGVRVTLSVARRTVTVDSRGEVTVRPGHEQPDSPGNRSGPE